MLNFSKWTNKAIAFTRSLTQLRGEVYTEVTVTPPVSLESVNLLSRSLRIPIPDPVQSFLTTASSACLFRYSWRSEELNRLIANVLPDYYSVIGGGDLCNMALFRDYQAGCADWAAAEMENATTGNPALARWVRAFPFLAVGNGDVLAIDVAAGDNNQPVIYLDHDYPTDVSVIAESFEHFLTEWEQLHYFSPDRWGPFLDPSSGFIDGSSRMAQELRNLFSAVTGE